MNPAALQKHVRDLGGLTSLDGSALRPLESGAQRAIETKARMQIPALLHWWFTTYGAGIKFAEPVVYTDPVEGDEALVGHFIDAEEVVQTIDDFEGSMAAYRIPINDDGFGNFIVVDRDGVVYKHFHDAPLGEAERRLAPSFEQFILMLRRGD
jgi:hypothetical protein